MLQLKTICPLLLLISICTGAAAQQRPAAEVWKFHSINSAGVLEGQAGSAFQLQSVNGVQYHSWFVGAGIGLDYYKFRTVPLFLDLRKSFRLPTNSFFVYTDIGMNSNWMTEKQKTDNFIYATQNVQNGLYLEGGGGYQINSGKTNALVLCLGYSYKALKGEETAFGRVFTPTPINTYRYTMQRLSVKIGWRF